jgi:hypothetical protein
MVARLKLKEIDGRAPPGVSSVLRQKATLRGWWTAPKDASWPIQAGDTPKLQEHPQALTTKLVIERYQWPG